MKRLLHLKANLTSLMWFYYLNSFFFKKKTIIYSCNNNKGNTYKCKLSLWRFYWSFYKYRKGFTKTNWTKNKGCQSKICWWRRRTLWNKRNGEWYISKFCWGRNWKAILLYIMQKKWRFRSNFFFFFPFFFFVTKFKKKKNKTKKKKIYTLPEFKLVFYCPNFSFSLPILKDIVTTEVNLNQEYPEVREILVTAFGSSKKKPYILVTYYDYFIILLFYYLKIIKQIWIK